MSVKVKSVDVEKVKVQIKRCPISVQRYISSLETVCKIQRETLDKAIKKLRELDAANQAGQDAQKNV